MTSPSGTAASASAMQDVAAAPAVRSPSRGSASSIAMQHDQADLRELRRLDREAAAEHDPRVRAVDRRAERRSTATSPRQARRVDDRRVRAQQPVVDSAAVTTPSTSPMARLSRCCFRNAVRVVAGSAARPGRRPDQQRAEQRQRAARDRRSASRAAAARESAQPTARTDQRRPAEPRSGLCACSRRPLARRHPWPPSPSRAITGGRQRREPVGGSVGSAGLRAVRGRRCPRRSRGRPAPRPGAPVPPWVTIDDDDVLRVVGRRERGEPGGVLLAVDLGGAGLAGRPATLSSGKPANAPAAVPVRGHVGQRAPACTSSTFWRDRQRAAPYRRRSRGPPCRPGRRPPWPTRGLPQRAAVGDRAAYARASCSGVTGMSPWPIAKLAASPARNT